MEQPIHYTPEEFPESLITSEGMFDLQADFSQNSCQVTLSVEYARKYGIPLHLHIIEPKQQEGSNQVYPLIMFIQGSGWMKQNTGYELAQLSRFSARGYVIAIVEYRPSQVAVFPAQIKDTKTAIRFMRKNAALYHADPDKLILWGDSSGGHTAVMAAVTNGHPEMEDGIPSEQYLPVKAVIDYYGPTDLVRIAEEPSIIDHTTDECCEGWLFGKVKVAEHPERVEPSIPMNYLTPDNIVPPIFILHGNKDRIVPFGQSVMLYEALRNTGRETVFYRLRGADHGGAPFWTEEIYDLVESFIRNQICH